MNTTFIKPSKEKKFYMISAYFGEGCSRDYKLSQPFNSAKEAPSRFNVPVSNGIHGDNCHPYGGSYGGGCTVGRNC